MVTPQLATWAVGKGYRYMHGKLDAHDMIARPEGSYIFSFSRESDSSKQAGAQALFGLIGALAASSYSQGYFVKLDIDRNTWQNQILKELKRELKGTAVPSYVKGLLSIRIKRATHDEQTFEAMEQTVYSTAGILKSHGVSMNGYCVHCGSTYDGQPCDEVDVAYKGGLALRPAHAACVKEQSIQRLQKLQNSQKAWFFLPALFVAMIGVLLGTVVGLLFVFLEFYFSVANFLAYFIIPMIGFSLYKKVRGPVKWYIIPFMLLLTGISITILVTWGDFMYIRSEYGNISLMKYLDAWEDAEFFRGVMIEMLISYIPGLIGVIMGWFSLKQDKKRREKLVAVLAQQTEPECPGSPSENFTWSEEP